MPGIPYPNRLISTRTPHAGSDVTTEPAMRDDPISTRTPHAGSDVKKNLRRRDGRHISTRTPHAGSDQAGGIGCVVYLISTRTPHAGSDRIVLQHLRSRSGFQPALPMRGVTVASRCESLCCSDFNPHSPCGE